MRKIVALLLLIAFNPAGAAEPRHAVAMHGTPAYGPDFKHFDYVNPDAPKGGTLSRHVPGTFDGFNAFIPRGVPAAGTNYLYDTLTVRSEDEPFTQYGLLAESMEIPADRSQVIFNLRTNAEFADGHPVTAADVVFSFNKLVNEGRPIYGFYYADVEKVEALNEHRVKFTFNKNAVNRELPLIVGQLQILPEHYWAERNFNENSLEAPLGSGPYEVADVEAGKRVVYKRRDDYWARDLPVNRGHYNFDRLVFEYFLDETVALEAFKGGEYNFRQENNSKFWARGYDSPALQKGLIIREEIPHSMPTGMQGFAMNLRKPLFRDKTLRRALAYGLDFEWSNQNLFYGQYKRTRSYFENSELEATGLPSEAELELLEPHRDALPPEVFNKSYQPPESEGTGRPRKNLSKAQQMLREAGYSIRDNRLHTPGGKPVSFEILLRTAAFERVVLPYARNLKALGIQADVRKVDPQQYQERVRKFDYDMIIATFPQSLSPGNEQRDFWHSSSAEREASRNLIGIQDPVVDDLVEKLIAAPSRDALVTRCRALDRVLQWGHYVVPNWHVDYFRVAWRGGLRHPEKTPPYGLAVDTWWHE